MLRIVAVVVSGPGVGVTVGRRQVWLVDPDERNWAVVVEGVEHRVQRQQQRGWDKGNNQR